MTHTVKNDSMKRLARMTGQLHGIQKMVEDERYCVDILTQVSALRAALDQFGLQMLSMHLETCVYGGDDPTCAGMNPEERREEIRVTLNRFLK
jgi:CsoR family transcriptional regulator, copper-sensing transcriptional repressor